MYLLSESRWSRGGERRQNRARKIEGGTTGVEREVVIGTIEEGTFTAQSL